MALPMVHLLAAWAWAQDKPELRENPDYYLGAISPDAIHIRDGGDKSRKDEFHLHNWRRPAPDEVLAYWMEHFTPFDLGYGIHVLLDGQWAVGFRRCFPEMLLPNGKPDPKIYYNDTCITDFELYHTSKLTPFLMDMVMRGRAPEDHPLLTRREFELWRRDTMAFYDRACPMSDPVRYIDRKYVEAFLRDCTEMMTETYERRCKLLNNTQKSILERRSTRGFSEEALTEAEIRNLADAALASPTACNYQDWHFSFVTDRALLEEFSREYRAGMLAQLAAEGADLQRKYAGYDVFFNAPLAVFITLPEAPRSRFAQVDAGIAVENLALSAQGMGLGSVILGRPMDVFRSGTGGDWERRFGFPEGHHYAIGIVIGHPTVTKEAHPVGENKLHFVQAEA